MFRGHQPSDTGFIMVSLDVDINIYIYSSKRPSGNEPYLEIRVVTYFTPLAYSRVTNSRDKLSRWEVRWWVLRLEIKWFVRLPYHGVNSLLSLQHWLFSWLIKKEDEENITDLVANASTASKVKLQDVKSVSSLGVQSWMGCRLSMPGYHLRTGRCSKHQRRSRRSWW